MSEAGRVFLSSPTNSTLFTTCCRVAICANQECCPKCEGKIWPGTSRGDRARWEYAFGNTREGQQLRKERAKGKVFLDDEDRYRHETS